MEVIKIDNKKILEDKDMQIKMMQQTLQGMQQQLIESKRKFSLADQRVKLLESRYKNDKFAKVTEIINLDDDDVDQSDNASVSQSESSNASALSSAEAKLIGIISVFLNVHPFGAGLDYITSYVNKSIHNLRPSDIETLMVKYPTVFKQDLVGIGANMERRWILTVFGKPQPLSKNNTRSREDSE